MSRACIEAPATYFRLSDETWAMIVEEYANGATAKQLGAKWKVAANSIYRHVGAARMTKRDCGDQRARSHARAVTLAKQARDAKLGPREGTVEPALTTLFAPAGADEAEAGDPAALARVAALASGRAMRGRLWSEAKALTALAECYQRMAGAEQARAAGTTETLPLTSVMDVRLASDARIAARFHISDRPGVKDPDRDLKESYWMVARMREDVEMARVRHLDDLKAHVARLEALMRGAGLSPPEFVSRETTIRMDARR